MVDLHDAEADARAEAIYAQARSAQPSSAEPSLRKRLSETFDGLAAAVSPRPRSNATEAQDLAALSRPAVGLAAADAQRAREQDRELKERVADAKEAEVLSHTVGSSATLRAQA